jgi:hypothetical protein
VGSGVLWFMISFSFKIKVIIRSHRKQRSETNAVEVHTISIFLNKKN